MIGTTSQVELAEPIKSCPNAEINRFADAFRAVARKQAGRDRSDTLARTNVTALSRLIDTRIASQVTANSSRGDAGPHDTDFETAANNSRRGSC
jgi:hypothetical protein